MRARGLQSDINWGRGASSSASAFILLLFWKKSPENIFRSKVSPDCRSLEKLKNLRTFNKKTCEDRQTDTHTHTAWSKMWPRFIFVFKCSNVYLLQKHFTGRVRDKLSDFLLNICWQSVCVCVCVLNICFVLNSWNSFKLQKQQTWTRLRFSFDSLRTDRQAESSRYILHVPRKTPTNACRAELGRYPLIINIQKRALFFNHPP